MPNSQYTTLLEAINTVKRTLIEGFVSINQRIDRLEQRIEKIEIRMTKLEAKMVELETRITDLEIEVKELTEKLRAHTFQCRKEHTEIMEILSDSQQITHGELLARDKKYANRLKSHHRRIVRLEGVVL